jgi:hypothetical protein
MRARNIKPSFFANEILGSLDPIVGLTFIGLWCMADRDGILEDRPLRIKGEVFPYREALDVNGYLTVLEREGFIQRYEVDATRYIRIINFEKHQHPHHTEKPRGYPRPEDATKPKTSKQRRSTRKEPPTPLDNGESTDVLGRTPSDSLIPDSLIPDSKTTASALPPWLPEERLQAFRAHRKSIRKPLTSEAERLLVLKLDRLRGSGHDPIALLNDAIEAGWQTVYEPRSKANGKQAALEARNRAVAEDFVRQGEKLDAAAIH